MEDVSRFRNYTILILIYVYLYKNLKFKKLKLLTNYIYIYISKYAIYVLYTDRGVYSSTTDLCQIYKYCIYVRSYFECVYILNIVI